MEKCYLKDNKKELSLTTYWTNEMEYDHYLFFKALNDTARKFLTQSEKPSLGSIQVNRYYIKLSVLTSKTFSLFSLIPDLGNYNGLIKENPVDRSLYITIYSGSSLNDNRTSIIYINSNTNQILDFYSTNSEDLEIILLKNTKNNGYNINISKSAGDYISDTDNIFTFNLSKKIYNLDKYYEANYEVYYMNHCDKQPHIIENRIIIIKREYHLISLNPQYLFESETFNKEINLKYDDNLSGKNINISIYRSDNESDIVFYSDKPFKSKETVIVILKTELEEGIYFIKTQIEDDNPFINKTLYFKVLQKTIQFKFNHHYFVINNAKENYLEITVNDTFDSFNCEIEEAFSKKKLDIIDCTKFRYNIYREGEIYFNYYYKDDNITSPIPIEINDKINVFQTYSSLFEISKIKECYYYKFDINIIFNEDFEYQIFLNKADNKENITLYHENGIYTINKIENPYSSFINNDGYYFIISEEYRLYCLWC